MARRAGVTWARAWTYTKAVEKEDGIALQGGVQGATPLHAHALLGTANPCEGLHDGAERKGFCLRRVVSRIANRYRLGLTDRRPSGMLCIDTDKRQYRYNTEKEAVPVKKQPKVLSEDERARFLAQFNRRYASPLRNLCMVTVMLDAGLRAGEVVALRPEHVDMTTCKLTVREGKGAKDRTLWIGGDLRDLIGEWLERRPDSEWLFPTRDGGQLDTRYLRAMVKRAARRAEVAEWEKVSPHTLRHTCATDLYRETHDILLVQEVLGHEDLSTTMIYTHLANGEVEDALKSFRQADEEGA